MTEALGFITTEFRRLTHFLSRDAGHSLWWWLTTLARLLPFLFHVTSSQGASSWLSSLGIHTFFFFQEAWREKPYCFKTGKTSTQDSLFKAQS